MMRLKPNFRRGYIWDVRLWALLIPAMLILANDWPVLATLLYSMSAILVVVAMAHTVRRVLFHYIDMEELYLKASQSPSGAAVVFLAVTLFVSSVMLATAMWIAR